MKIDRRGALGLLGSGAMLPAIGTAQAAEAVASFAHGVASGDPTVMGAILWTRVTPAQAGHAAAIPVSWHVALTPDGQPVESGEGEARPARDFTVKVEPKRLKPGTDYHFWFALADGTRSPVGRFRTLPQGRTADVVMAVVSCQLYPGGFFHAYTSIAGQPRLDAVLHLGDYIYEYDVAGYGAETGKITGRVPEPTHEIVTLTDYRMRHAQYKRDPALQAAHARAAFICVWDDHETANDSWMHGAENHQPATEGNWDARKAAAMQAYFEWMPIRDPLPGKPWDAINREFLFGDLASLLMVETRLLARSEQAAFKGEAPDAAEAAQVLAVRNRPDRELLGAPQRRWIEDRLAASVKAGQPWQVIGNQVVMARVNGPILARMFGPEKAQAMLAALDAKTRATIESFQAVFAAGIPYNMDSWDGYPAERERLYASFGRAGAAPLVLSGDSHAFWANKLADDAGKPIAVEFGTSAITSPSIGDGMPQVPMGDLLRAASPEVAYCDQKAKGYILLTLTPGQAKADYVAVSTVLEPSYTVSTIAQFTVDPAKKTELVRV